MGQRMSPQKVLCLKQGDQSSQGSLRYKISRPRCMLSKSPPPILLSLTTPPRKPTTQGDLLEETQKNREPDHLKPPIIDLGPQGMDRSTVRAAIPLEQQGFWKIIEISRHIPMTPQPWASAPRTPGRTGPGVLLPLFLKKIDIDGKIQYQETSLWGITEGTSPAREYTLGYPFSFPSIYPEKKKDLYNKR